jgi:glycosyltransferase involved in cell wall biosynthesis
MSLSSPLPPVSVVVPTHNRPELLRGTVRSILGQRYAGSVECLVVFDRQEPQSVEVEVPAGRVLRLLVNDRTPGPAGAYNVGALAAGGDYFALCDDDDEWLPDKLAMQVEALEQRPDAVFATCGIYLGDGALTRNPTRIPEREVLTLDDLLNSARNELHSSTFIVRRRAMLDRVGLVDENIPHSYGEDYDWLLRAARVAPVLAVRQPLVRVRWQFSYFSDRWQAIIDGLEYQLEHRSELHRQPRNLSRIYGRLAFAHAALGRGAVARKLARQSLWLSWRQPRAYLAYLVSLGLLRPRAVLRIAHALGKGV